jgi:DUF2075 family protein
MSTIHRMLAYLASKSDFLVQAPDIEDRIRDAVKHGLGLTVPIGSPEYQSWHNSLGNAMFHVINSEEIPDDAGVAVEYRINGRRQRIDFIIAGRNCLGEKNVVIVELKQWTRVEHSDLRDHVRTAVGGGIRDQTHPSYQAWSYARQMLDFYEVVQTEGIGVRPCAYIHNCDDRSVLQANDQYENVAKAPLFFKGEHLKLRRHIVDHIAEGPGVAMLQQIDKSRMRPGKQLVEALSSMMKGNDEFALIDDQKLVLESILDIERKTLHGDKSTIIVGGGPGTGKSLIAVNGLVRLSKEDKNVRYVSKNAAPRRVYEAKLKGSMRTAEITELFVSSDAFREVSEVAYDVLLVDEAHRLTEKGGLYGNLGENQIAEVMNCARVAVFFIDEDQKVTWRDIGDVAEIERWARASGSAIHRMDLFAQFRCAGSDEYLRWLDHLLGISEQPSVDARHTNYDFQVADTPSRLRDLIFDKNRGNNRSRLVAGYCWNWVSKKDPRVKDIVFEGTDFAMKWNLMSDGSTWMIAPKSVNEVGCIHTCQGLECDYIGVIIGPDLIYRNGALATDPFARARTDQSLKGFKTAFKEDPAGALARADILIRNTYRTLMSRGMNGCYVYSTDSKTQRYFQDLLNPGNDDAICIFEGKEP